MAAIDGSFSASFFRAPLLNNSHFELARIGDPVYAEKLQERYEQFAATLPAQLERAMHARIPGAKIIAVTIVGSAVSFRHYNDIDINILASGSVRARSSAPNFSKFFRVADEKHGSIQKTVELFPYSTGQLQSNIYANFFFSKPVLFGTLPDLFGDQLQADLANAFVGSLNKFNVRLGMGMLRKATHSLTNACRHTYTIRGLQGRQVPSEFSYVVKALYGMDIHGKHDETTLERLHGMVSQWDVETPAEKGK